MLFQVLMGALLAFNLGELRQTALHGCPRPSADQSSGLLGRLRQEGHMVPELECIQGQCGQLGADPCMRKKFKAPVVRYPCSPKTWGTEVGGPEA